MGFPVASSFKICDVLGTASSDIYNLVFFSIYDSDRTTISTTDVNGFVEDMNIGLDSNQQTSSCKMLPSRVRSIPNGTEVGIYYAIDWGGTNYRIIRMELFGKHKQPKIDSVSYQIPSEYKQCKQASELFDYVASLFKNFMKRFDEHDPTQNNGKQFDVGFTFSFALKKTKLDEGILIAWNKGFDIDNVVGKDIVKLMNAAFDRLSIPARIKAICNDTVGTLLSCSYYNGTDTTLGIIIGTGTNAAYIEPELDDEIINTEWCYFDGNMKYLPRIEDTDLLMDTYTTNCGEEYTEKMISGMYLAEIVRLIFMQCFEDKMKTSNVSSTSIMRDRFGKFTAVEVGRILSYYYDADFEGLLNDIIRNDYRYGLYDSTFDKDDCKILGRICELIVNRSADLVAALLLGVLQRIKFVDDKLSLLKTDKRIIIGIDGSVFLKMPRYSERIMNTMRKLAGDKVVNNIKIVHAEDGSGIGAALCVAALRKHNQLVSKL